MMLKELNTDEVPELQSQWLSAFWRGERTRLLLFDSCRAAVLNVVQSD